MTAASEEPMDQSSDVFTSVNVPGEKQAAKRSAALLEIDARKQWNKAGWNNQKLHTLQQVAAYVIEPKDRSNLRAACSFFREHVFDYEHYQSVNGHTNGLCRLSIDVVYDGPESPSFEVVVNKREHPVTVDELVPFIKHIASMYYDRIGALKLMGGWGELRHLVNDPNAEQLEIEHNLNSTVMLCWQTLLTELAMLRPLTFQICVGVTTAVCLARLLSDDWFMMRLRSVQIFQKTFEGPFPTTNAVYLALSNLALASPGTCREISLHDDRGPQCTAKSLNYSADLQLTYKKLLLAAIAPHTAQLEGFELNCLIGLTQQDLDELLALMPRLKTLGIHGATVNGPLNFSTLLINDKEISYRIRMLKLELNSNDSNQLLHNIGPRFPNLKMLRLRLWKPLGHEASAVEQVAHEQSCYGLVLSLVTGIFNYKRQPSMRLSIRGSTGLDRRHLVDYVTSQNNGHLLIAATHMTGGIWLVRMRPGARAPPGHPGLQEYMPRRGTCRINLE